MKKRLLKILCWFLSPLQVLFAVVVIVFGVLASLIKELKEECK